MSSITEQPAPTVSRPIRLTVNGQPVTTSFGMLDQFLTEAGYVSAHVATAVNGAFIPQRARTTTALADGDRVEILSPRQGG